MRVPIRRTPDTQAHAGELSFARGATTDLSPIAQGLGNLSEAIAMNEDRIREEQRQRQQFDLGKRLLAEKLRLDEDFETRRRSPDQDAYGFAERIEEEGRTTHEAILNEYWEAGYDEDLLQDFALRLGGVREEYFAKGLAHQTQVLRARSIEETDELGTMASQVVGRDPDAFAAMEDQLRVSIFSNPDLTEVEKIELFNRQLLGLKGAGAKAFATARPEETFALLDPQGIYRKQNAVPGEIVRVNAGGQQGEVAQVLSSGGLPGNVVAGFLGNFDVEGGYDGALGDNGTASGIAQWRNERRENFVQMFGKDPHQASLAEQAQFVLWEMQNPTHPSVGMTVAQRDAILRAGSAEEAAELIDKYYERSSGEHRERRKELASGYAAITSIEIPASSATQTPALEPREVTEQPEEYNPTLALTGNPLLDSLTGEERLQMLGWAEQELGRKAAQEGAAMDVTVQNIISEALNNGGQVSTAIPSEEEILRVYGPVKGPQVKAEIDQTLRVGQSIQQFRTLSPEEIQRKLELLTPQPGSDTFAVEQKIFEAAQSAASRLLDEREDDPAAYALKYFPELREAAGRSTKDYYATLDRVYQKLGIDPDTAQPLPDTAVARAVEQYSVMDPSQKRAYLQEQSGAMTEERFQRFVKSLKGTTAEDDAYIYMLMKSWKGYGPVFDRVLSGREQMAKDPAKRPSTQTVNTAYRAEVASAMQNLNPDASRAINEAAIALYVQAGGDPTAAGFDSNLYAEQLALAMGGSLPADMGRGAAEDATILPPGVSESSFENWVNRLRPRDLTQLSVEGQPPVYADGKTPALLEDIQDDGVFVMTSPGVYIIKMASDGKPLFTKSGRPFRVRISPKVIGTGGAVKRVLSFDPLSQIPQGREKL